MTKQELIIAELGIASSFDVALEARKRIDFLRGYLRTSGFFHGRLGTRLQIRYALKPHQLMRH